MLVFSMLRSDGAGVVNSVQYNDDTAREVPEAILRV